MTTTNPNPTLDPFVALQEAGAVPAVTDDALMRSLSAVRHAASEERPDPIIGTQPILRGPRARFGMAAVGLVAASLVAGTILVESSDRVGAPAAASEVLERAATAALAEEDLVTAPGQYLRITLTEQYWTASTGDGREVLIGSDGMAAVSQERRTRVIWVPHDVDADWTVRETTRVLRNNSSDPRYQAIASPELNGTRTQPSWAADDSRTYVRTYDPDWYATLSRDPDVLMAEILEGDTSEGQGTAYEFQEIYSEVLRSGIAPPDVRAALFRALADTSGMVVDRDVATLDGRKGTALGHEDSNWQMVFDAETGAYLGERTIDPDFPRVEWLDEHGTTWLTSVRTQVVSSAPRTSPEY